MADNDLSWKTGSDEWTIADRLATFLSCEFGDAKRELMRFHSAISANANQLSTQIPRSALASIGQDYKLMLKLGVTIYAAIGIVVPLWVAQSIGVLLGTTAVAITTPVAALIMGLAAMALLLLWKSDILELCDRLKDDLANFKA